MRFIARNSPWASDAPRFDESSVHSLTDGWDYNGHTRTRGDAVIYLGPGLWTPGGVDAEIDGVSLAANEEGARLLREAEIIG